MLQARPAACPLAEGTGTEKWFRWSDDVQFDGHESFPLGRNQLWRLLIDTAILSRCIPHVYAVDEITDDSIHCRVKPGLSFLSGSVKLHFHFQPEIDQEKVVVTVIARPIGGSLTTQVELLLDDLRGGSQIRWSAEIIERGGLLRPISTSLLQIAAQRIIEQLWQNLHDVAQNPNGRTQQG